MIGTLYKFKPLEEIIYILHPVYIMCLMNHGCLSTFARGPLQQYVRSHENKLEAKKKGTMGAAVQTMRDGWWVIASLW